jgi:hypothetical protein
MMMGVSINPCVYIDASVPEDLHSDLEASGQVPCRAVVGGETTGFIARKGKLSELCSVASIYPPGIFMEKKAYIKKS